MHPYQTLRFYFSVLWGQKLEICPQTNKSMLHSEKVVSKTKTPKTKTHSKAKLCFCFFYKGVRWTRDHPMPGYFPVHHCVVNMVIYSMTSENKKVRDTMEENLKYL